MDVCLLWVLCVVRSRSLRRADHSSRRVLLIELRRFVWPRNVVIEEAMTRVGPQGHRGGKSIICSTRHEWRVHCSMYLGAVQHSTTTGIGHVHGQNITILAWRCHSNRTQLKSEAIISLYVGIYNRQQSIHWAVYWPAQHLSETLLDVFVYKSIDSADRVFISYFFHASTLEWQMWTIYYPDRQTHNTHTHTYI